MAAVSHLEHGRMERKIAALDDETLVYVLLTLLGEQEAAAPSSARTAV